MFQFTRFATFPYIFREVTLAGGFPHSEISGKGGDPAAPSDTATLLRLHPSHESHRGERPPRKVKLPTSGETHSHGVTGGVYKTRERIHRGMLIRDY
jgi:hypothetical protein